jgi:hypothetical protein
VPDGDPLVESSQADRERGRRVPVHQNDIGPLAAQNVTHAEQHVAGDVVEVLTRFHHGQVVVGLDPEHHEDLVKHLAMLAGDDDGPPDAGVGGDPFDDGGHLDGFGTGPEGAEDVEHVAGRGARRGISHRTAGPCGTRTLEAGHDLYRAHVLFIVNSHPAPPRRPCTR